MGVATAVRSARESVRGTRTLVGALLDVGFRAVMIEGVDAVASHLDHHVQTGEGDPAALLVRGRGFVRNLEHLDLVRSVRRWNVAHPDDPVSVVDDRWPRPLPARGHSPRPFLAPSPPADFLENALVGIDDAPRLLDPSARDEDVDATPAEVRRWLDVPLRTRMIGPVDDASRDHEARVDAGPVRDTIDAAVHLPTIAPVTPLR